MNITPIHSLDYAVKIHQRNEQLPWLLMLHGFMGDHRAFDHLVGRLCQFCNPVTVDLLGHGGSSAPGDPGRYRENCQLRDLHELIRILNISPLFLHGYSMGGRLALKLAHAHPEYFSGLILESTTNGIVDKPRKRERRQTDRQRAAQIEDDYQGFLSRWEEALLFQSPAPVDESRARKYEQIHREQKPRAMAASLRGFGTGFMTAIPAEQMSPNLPTLLIAGSADQKYQQINSRLAAYLPHGRLAVVEAGHRVHLDNPADFVHELKLHIDQHSTL
ncbi:alpha/beta fold hydrolase [Fodinibius sediminis]|uniref:2-succinyl-6-hydroxy-2,4-cyclohexadiene-1-carboxylate synthase n=1 Tax=Fodinibius sediminis TaxID=1214077 RepID=A0A521B7M3_9BACT|nr:alpha/beta fold hydrolase [Fodinibius sediminis]SMO43094.1 2-succinyl-6-hydroxy-2,4-cyclohexadiene-1-carboxylate synthase [Fodinibius sediminis]